VQFVTSADLVCGMELLGGGQKIGWSMAEYLDAMGKRLAEQMRAQGDAGDAPQTPASPAAASPPSTGTGTDTSSTPAAPAKPATRAPA